ncbi:MAG TPA: nuclear transport factor 2 family protein [Abditibacterium sp.]|jgi:hypothetical protein
MRKIFIFGGLFLLLISAVLTWRYFNPPLSDKEQIALALDEICAAAEARSARGIANYLSKDFKFGAQTSKKDFQNSLVGGILQYRVINLDIAGVKVDVNSATATSDGRYVLNLRSEANSPPEILSGQFLLKWRKIDGQWLITNANGENALFGG